MSPFVPVLAAFIGGTIALLGIYLKSWIDRRKQDDRTSKIVWAEFDDISRHFDRNVSRLRTMRYFLNEKSMWPDVNHLEKLKWPEDTFIFSEESVKFSGISTVRSIYKMRLRLRNANLDADAAMRAFATGETQIFVRALDFVEQRHARIEALALDFTHGRKASQSLSKEQEEAAFESTRDMLFYPNPIAIGS